MDSKIRLTQLDKSLFSVLNEESLYRKIIESETFKRLKTIHFLGAIDYLFDNKQKHTRYEHTLSVVTLALQFAHLSNLKFADQKYLVCAALLHDIGHAPLSHSMEPSFRKKFNISHHVAGINIIKGNSPLGNEIQSILNEYDVDSNKLIDLLSGNSKEKYALAFDNPINIDTIDGIIRTSTYLPGSNKSDLTPSKVLNALFDVSKQNILEEFWQLKNSIYEKWINKKINILADNYSQEYISTNSNISLNDFYLSETKFKEKHQSLFETLARLNKLRISKKLSYTKRSYKINQWVVANELSDFSKKYTYTKTPAYL